MSIKILMRDFPNPRLDVLEALQEELDDKFLSDVPSPEDGPGRQAGTKDWYCRLPLQQNEEVSERRQGRVRR